MCVKAVLFCVFLRRGLSGIHLLPGWWEPRTCCMPRSRLSGTEICALNSQAFSSLWTSEKTRKASLSLFVPSISPSFLERGKGLLVPAAPLEGCLTSPTLPQGHLICSPSWEGIVILIMSSLALHAIFDLSCAWACGFVFSCHSPQEITSTCFLD